MITFTSNYSGFALKDKRVRKKWLSEVIDSYGKKPGDISYVFLSDEALLEINKAYLNHHTFTDIITFDLSENALEVSADIFISIDRIKENSQKFMSSFEEEMNRVMVHGILHLCGLKDKKQKEKEIMRNAENNALNTYASKYNK